VGRRGGSAAQLGTDAACIDATRSHASPPPTPLPRGPQNKEAATTWKVWQWPPDGTEFYDSDSFRAHIHEHALRPELLALLPRDDPKAPEKPAERALRERMSELLVKIQNSTRQLQVRRVQGRGVGGGAHERVGCAVLRAR